MNGGGKIKDLMVLMTCEKEEEAKKIASELLIQKKAACVSIFPKGDSFFWWEGKIEESKEYLLIAKTISSLLDDLIKVVKEIHSYEVPEIIALPVIGGNENYLNWLHDELGK